jgi:hypothetical protein
MDRNKLPLEPRHLRVPSGASKTIPEPMVRSVQNRAPISHRHKHCIQTDRNKIWHDPCHLGVPLDVSKMISKPMVHSAQTMHLSCVKIRSISKWTEMSFHLSLITLEYHRVHPKPFWPYCTFGANRAPILHRHKHCLQIDQNKIRHDPCRLGVPSGASKTINEPMVRSVQTVHLSWVKISSISKQTETSFHLSLVT